MKNKNTVKRKSDIPSTKSPKKKKIEKDEYTEIHFKVQLKDPNTTFLALEKFCTEAEGCTDGNGYDIVAGYCRSSEECIEIIQLLETGRRKPTELQLIFETLECILLRLVDDLSSYYTVGHNIVNKVWGSHSTSIYDGLAPRNKSSLIKTTLKLMTAMVMLGGIAAKTVLTQLNFNSDSIQALYNRRDKKDPQDVRTCFIHFILSFMLTGSDNAIRQLMDAKALTSALFSGLYYDRIETVQLVLSTLLDKVILNPVISKTQKVRVFNEENMKHLGNLYHWKGLCGIQAGKKYGKQNKEEEEIEVDVEENVEEKEMVSEAVHKVLMKLCTTYKYGVIFFDKTFGTSQKNHNHILISCLTSLTRVTDKPLVQELITAALVACPDQIKNYLPCFQNSISPRLSEKWLATMAFIMKIYKSQPDNFNIHRISEIIPGNKLPSVLLTTILPLGQTWNSAMQGLKNKDLLVRHVVLDLIKLGLERFTSLMRYLESKSADSLRSLYKAEEWEKVIGELKETMAKALPEFQYLLACWEKLIDKIKGKDADTSSEVSALTPVSEASHMIRLEQVLSLYQEVFPSCLTDNPTNISLIMEGVKIMAEHDKNDDSDQEFLPQLYLLKLLAKTDSKKLPWVKESKEGHSLMYLLLTMINKVKVKPRLVRTTQHLICQLLEATGLFNFNKEEIFLWIRHFTKSVNEADDTTLINFLSKVFTTFISNPYPYTDKVNDCSLNAMDLMTKGEDTCMDSVSIDTTDNRLDALLEMNEDEIDEMNVDETEEDTSDQRLRFPFSPLIIVALESAAAKENCKPQVADFLSGVLWDIFHNQQNPYPLLYLINIHKDVAIDKTIRSYMKSFSYSRKDKKPSMDFDAKSTLDEVGVILAKTYATGNLGDNQTVLANLKSVQADNIPLLTNQILLYISQILKLDKKDENLRKMLQYLFKCLEELVNVQVQDCKVNIELDPSEQDGRKEGRSDSEDEDEQEADGSTGGDHEDEMETDVIKEKVGTSLAGKNSETSQVKVPDKDSEFDQLFIKEKSGKEILEEIILTILKNPVILKYFLYVSAEDQSVVFPDTEKLQITPFSRMVTANMCNLIKQCASQILMFQSSDCFKDYVRKVEFFLQNIKNHDAKKLSNNIQHLQTILPILVRELSHDRTRGMLETILKIHKNFLIENGKISVIGQVAIEMTNQIIDSMGDRFLKLDDKCVQCLFSLQAEVCDNELTDCCIKLINQQPHLAAKVDSSLITSLVKSENLLCLTLAENLIVHNVTIGKKFMTQFQKGVFDKCLEKILPLLLVIVRQYQEKDNKVLLNIVSKYKEQITTLFECPSSNDVNGIVQLVMSLVNCGQLDKQELFSSYMKSASSNGIKVPDHVKLLHFLSGDKPNNFSILLPVLFKSVTDDLGNKENSNTGLVDSLMDKLEVILKVENMEINIENKLVQKLIKTTLRSRYSDQRTFRIISQFVRRTSDWPEGLPIATLYQMMMSHSLFLPIMFNEKHPEVKESICDLLLRLLETDPSVCSSQHYGVFLGSYSATLTQTDQILLKIMYLYEKNKCAITDYRPYLWGPKSIEHYSVQKTIGPSLLKKASVDQVLENLDEAKLQLSVLNFPLGRKLENFHIQTSKECKSQDEVYDPAFILPLFGHLLSPDQLIDCRKFTNRGCLSYVLAALSCHDNTIRGSAYFVLDRFVLHLEGSKFHEKRELLYMMNFLRNSIEKPNMKLACVITLYLARMVKLLHTPELHMYKMISMFLYFRPTLDVRNVPDFYRLFMSATLEYKEERIWILSLLLDGLRETFDYQIYQNRYIFNILLSYFDTAVSDTSSQSLVLKIVHRAVQDKSIAKDLTREHGIQTWLINVISTSSGSKRTEVLTDIIHSLWDATLSSLQKKPDGTARCLPITLSMEMAIACKKLLYKLGNDTPKETAMKLLDTLLCILNHIKHTTTVHEKRRNTIGGQTLTLTDITAITNLTSQFKGQKRSKLKDDKDKNSQGDEETKFKSGQTLECLALKIYLYWKPFNSHPTEGNFIRDSYHDNELCHKCLEMCSWILEETKQLDNLDLAVDVLDWISINMKDVPLNTNTNDSSLQQVTNSIIELLIQLYSQTNNSLNEECISVTTCEKVKDLLVTVLNLMAGVSNKVQVTEDLSSDETLMKWILQF